MYSESHLKTSVLTLFAFLAFSFTGLTHAQSQEGPSSGRVMLVLDASGSMWGEINGKDKILIAREVIRDLMGNWNQGMEVGLSAYGHRAKGDCNDIQTVVPVGRGHASSIAQTVNSLTPKGKTPLSRAVKLAAEHLSYTEAPATVILVTDGIETCNADPCALGRELAATGVEFRAHVIGFDIAKEDQADLQCLAESTGGLFFDARNASQLSEALSMTVARVEEESGPKHQFNTVLVDGGEVLPRGWYAQTLSWKFLIVDEAGNKASQATELASGADAQTSLETGSYVVELHWDAIRVEYPFKVDASERAQHVISLKGGLVDLTASLTSSSDNITQQVQWTIYAGDGDGGRGDKLLFKSGSSVKIAVPAGNLIVAAKFDNAIAEETISINAGEQTAAHVNFRAGSTTFTVVDESGSPVRGYQTWTVYELDADGIRRKVAFKSNAAPKFVLSAGNYVVELVYDKEKYEGEFLVEEGQHKTVRVTVQGS